MAKIFTNNFKTYLIDKITSSNPLFYMYLGKHTAFADDSNPPTPTDSVTDTYVGAFDNMIVGKGIRPADMSYMIPRNEWASGVGYRAYRDNAGDLFGNNFYVSVASASGYDVFKCLSNNDTLSTYPPDLSSTSPEDDVYETADGYQWKYMYSIPQSTFDKFATRDYIPVYPQANVVAAAVSGAIDYIDVTYGGSNYDGFTNGTFQTVTVNGNSQIFMIESSASSNASFYVGSAIKITQGVGAGQMRVVTGYSVSGSTRTVIIDEPFDVQPTTTSSYEITPHVVVVGGGSAFQGRALINAASSNSVYKVEIVNRGHDYYYGTASVVGNTGGISNSAVLSIVISPNNGHGADPIRELGGKYLGLTTTFDTTDLTSDTKMLDVNEFRTVGIIANPQLANVELTYTSATGIFTVGETITQQDTGATGRVTQDNGSVMQLTNVSGNFLAGNSSYRYIVGNTGLTPVSASVISVRNNGSANLTANVAYVNLTTRVALSTATGTFSVDEMVTMTGNVQTSNAVVYFANSSAVWLTSVRGVIGSQITGLSSGAVGTVDSITPPDFVHGTGQILYLENISPINKAAGQTETIKAIIEF